MLHIDSPKVSGQPMPPQPTLFNDIKTKSSNKKCQTSFFRFQKHKIAKNHAPVVAPNGLNAHCCGA